MLTPVAPSALRPPSELTRHKAWLCWNLEQFQGEAKPRKVPYYTDGTRRHGTQGSPEDLANLDTFEAAVEAATRAKVTGIGFAPLPQWGITALDFDACIRDGKIDPEVLAVLGGGYIEISPSGTGLRSFVRGNMGNHKSFAKDGRFGFEAFATKGYVTVTGNVPPGWDMVHPVDRIIPEIGQGLRDLAASRFERPAPAEVPPEDDQGPDPFRGLDPRFAVHIDKALAMLSWVPPDTNRFDWIQIGMGLHYQFQGDEAGFHIWNEWSSGGSKYPGESGLREQWNSFSRVRSEGHRSTTIATMYRIVREHGGDPNNPVIKPPKKVRTASGSPAAPKPLPPRPVPSVTDQGSPAPDPMEEASFPPSDAFSGLPDTVFTDDPPEDPMRVVGAGGQFKRQSPGWWIKGVVPRQKFILVYGPPGSGKSFFVLHMAGCIAREKAWFGRRVRKGRVIVVAAEGGASYGDRTHAYARHHGIQSHEFDIGAIFAAPNLLELPDPLNDRPVTTLIDKINRAGDIGVVVIDTLAAVTVGANENAAEDMGRAISNCKYITEQTGASVILVHHTGKDVTKGARGWSGLNAATDAELEITRHDNGLRSAKATKMKDGADEAEFPFRLHVVNLGLDEDGDPITSCVVIETDEKPPTENSSEDRKVKKFTEMEDHVMAVIMARDDKTKSMLEIDLVDLAASSFEAPLEGQHDTRAGRVKEAIESLVKRKGSILKEGNRLTFLK
tara:strand:+ start:1029 stop:3206 length:2178 start_codon:yes stop_codon:yes gene_type:complete